MHFMQIHIVKVLTMFIKHLLFNESFLTFGKLSVVTG